MDRPSQPPTRAERIHTNRWKKDGYFPTNGRRKKTDFWCFQSFFYLYTPQKRRKHDTSLDFAAFLRQRKILTQKVSQKVPLKANFDKKIGKKRRKLRCRKMPQNLTKCRVCGVFAAHISGKKVKKLQNPFTMSLGCESKTYTKTRRPLLGTAWRSSTRRSRRRTPVP